MDYTAIMAKIETISPFATSFPAMPELQGVALHTAHTAMRYDRNDLLFVTMPQGTQAAGVFTTNSIPGEPVIWAQEILPRGTARGLVVNAGMANVFTGEAGRKSVLATTQKAAEIIGCTPEEIYISSTGVIGERINDTKLLDALDNELQPANWQQAARAIMTTDTFPKGAHATAIIGDVEVNLCGIVKGSGMIAPNMATMLGYVWTDAKIPADILQKWLNAALQQSYHAITVDSDTSTSDTILCFATGTKDHWDCHEEHDPAWEDFREKFIALHKNLAMQVIKDGEGITKLMEVTVEGAKDDGSAHIMALSIANSPLVKTAVAGADPNWGRIIMAVGKTGEPVSRQDVSIWIGACQVTKNSTVCADYKELEAAQYMRGSEIAIRVDVGYGSGKATVYGCDLTHAYIDINADYRS